MQKNTIELPQSNKAHHKLLQQHDVSRCRPILFSTPMVRAILDGRKTQTRRIIKPHKYAYGGESVEGLNYINWDCNGNELIQSPKHKIGDVLWVRETWQKTTFLHPLDDEYGYIYKASENGREWAESDEGWTWKPSIFMPKEACRLFLKVTNVRAEPLQDITDTDIVDEGISATVSSTDPTLYLTYKEAFQQLWQSINGKESWDLNPWVWVYNFEKTERPLGFC